MRTVGYFKDFSDLFDLIPEGRVRVDVLKAPGQFQPARKPRFANVECERLPDGRIKVLGFKNFLTPTRIKERIGEKMYLVWLNGPHMYPVNAEWIRTIWISATYRGSSALLIADGVYQPADFEGRIDYMRECGKRLGELVKLRKQQLAEEAKQAPVKLTFEI